MQKFVNAYLLRESSLDVNLNYQLLSFVEIISIVVSIRVDKIYDRKVVWDRGFTDKDSEPYQTLAYEANRAVSLVEFYH